jgi:putative endonuclease
MYFAVYIIYSPSLDRYYIGFTGDEINSRLKKHNANHKGFTGKKSDWILKYTEVFGTKPEAIQKEKEIKSWKSRVKIQQLLSIE